MAPANLARLVIDCFNNSFAPQTVIRTCPSIGAVRRLGKVDAITRMRINNKQPRLGVETRRAIVGQTALVWSNKSAVRCGFFLRVRNRPAQLVNSRCPVHRAIRNRQKALSIRTIQYEEVSVPRALHQHLPPLSMGSLTRSIADQ